MRMTEMTMSERAKMMQHRITTPRLPKSQKPEPVSVPLESTLSRIRETLSTRKDWGSTGVPNGQGLEIITSSKKPELQSAAGEPLGAHGVAKRWSSKLIVDPVAELERLRAVWIGTKPQLLQWLNGPRREWKAETCPNGLMGMRKALISPPSGSLREVLAVHDLAYMALAQRVDDAELGRLLAGSQSALRGSADAASSDGLHAWQVGLDGMPLYAIRWAFARWVKENAWMPSPADIRKMAKGKAQAMHDLRNDCRAALMAKTEEVA